MQSEDRRPVIAVTAGESAYDLGHAAETRNVPVNVDFALWDATVDTSNEGVELFNGPMNLDLFAMAIVDAIKGIKDDPADASGFGDELAQANLTTETSDDWPMCRGRLQCVFSMKRGTDFEPTLTI